MKLKSGGKRMYSIKGLTASYKHSEQAVKHLYKTAKKRKYMVQSITILMMFRLVFILLNLIFKFEMDSIPSIALTSFVIVYSLLVIAMILSHNEKVKKVIVEDLINQQRAKEAKKIRIRYQKEYVYLIGLSLFLVALQVSIIIIELW